MQDVGLLALVGGVSWIALGAFEWASVVALVSALAWLWVTALTGPLDLPLGTARGALVFAAFNAATLIGARLEQFRGLAAAHSDLWTRWRTPWWALSALALGVLTLFQAQLALALCCALAAPLAIAPFACACIFFNEGKGPPPRLKHLIGGWLALTYVMTAQATLFGLILPLALFVPRRARDLMRYLSYRGMDNLFNWFPYGKRERIGFDEDVFKRPALIVSNHQSAADIPLVLALPADVRLTVNPRVWRAPFFGFGARAMGHVLVERDHPDVTLERCRSKLDEGAHVHTFPEGTRTEGAYPKRFHRGAFEIACELQCDIVPIILCNTRSCIPRDAFWVGDYNMSVRVLERISPSTFDYSQGSRTLTKHVQTVVRDAVVAETARLQHGTRLRCAVLEHYAFSGRGIERAAARELPSGAALDAFVDAFAACQSVVEFGSGLGTRGVALTLAHLRLKYCGIEADDVQRATAARVMRANKQASFRATAAAGDQDGCIISEAFDPERYAAMLASMPRPALLWCADLNAREWFAQNGWVPSEGETAALYSSPESASSSLRTS